MSKKNNGIKAPFENESESVSVEFMTFENRKDRVTMYGDLDITKDKAGLQKLQALQSVLKTIEDKLVAEAANLPDKIPDTKASVDVVSNPFAKP